MDVVQIYAMPVFDMIETVLVKKFRFPPGFTLRLIARSTYVGNASIKTKLFSIPLAKKKVRLMR